MSEPLPHPMDAPLDLASRAAAHRAARRAARALRPRRFRVPKLSTTIKVLLLFSGWFLILLGLLGLVLPFLQGILFLALGAAILSLVSSTIYLGLRRVFSRWPRGWRRLLLVRKRMHRWLEKRFGDKS